MCIWIVYCKQNVALCSVIFGDLTVELCAVGLFYAYRVELCVVGLFSAYRV